MPETYSDGPSYPAARTVARRLQERIDSSPLAFKTSTTPKPSADFIEEIITKAFWASLRREEGHAPKISIAFLPPDQTVRPLLSGTHNGKRTTSVIIISDA